MLIKALSINKTHKNVKENESSRKRFEDNDTPKHRLTGN